MNVRLYEPTQEAKAPIAICGQTLAEIIVAAHDGHAPVETVLEELRALEDRVDSESQAIQRQWVIAMLSSGAVAADVEAILALLT